MKSKYVIYENLPIGGGRRTYQTIKRIFTSDIKLVLKGILINPINIIHYLYGSIITSFVYDNKISRKINENDILICFQSWLINSPYILYLAKSKNKYYICHEPPREYYDNQLILHKDIKERIVDFIRYPIKVIDKFIVKKSKPRIISNSNYSKSQIISAYQMESKVIYPSVDKSFFLFENRKIKYNKNNQVITVGSIAKHKRIDFLLEVVSKIPEDIRPTLVVVSSSVNKKYLDQLIRLAKKLGVKFRLKYNISNKNLINEYLKSKAFLFAPINEPFGISIIEAIVLGIPVITYRFGGGYTEVISNKHAEIIDNLDSQIWANIIVNKLTTKIIVKTDRRVFSKNFTPERYAREVMEYINTTKV